MNLMIINSNNNLKFSTYTIPENSVNHDQDDQASQHNSLPSLEDGRQGTLQSSVRYPAQDFHSKMTIIIHNKANGQHKRQ